MSTNDDINALLGLEPSEIVKEVKTVKQELAVLTPDIFDKIDETEPGVGGEIQLTDALSKLDAIYGNTFEGKTYDIGNRFEWLKTSIEFAMDDEESRDDLIGYMKEIIKEAE